MIHEKSQVRPDDLEMLIRGMQRRTLGLLGDRERLRRHFELLAKLKKQRSPAAIRLIEIEKGLLL